MQSATGTYPQEITINGTRISIDRLLRLSLVIVHTPPYYLCIITFKISIKQDENEQPTGLDQHTNDLNATFKALLTNDVDSLEPSSPLTPLRKKRSSYNLFQVLYTAPPPLTATLAFNYIRVILVLAN